MFPHTHKSRTTFESSGRNAHLAAQSFAEMISDAGYDAVVTDDDAVEHTCEDSEVFAPLMVKAEKPYVKASPADSDASAQRGSGSPSSRNWPPAAPPPEGENKTGG